MTSKIPEPLREKDVRREDGFWEVSPRKSRPQRKKSESSEESWFKQEFPGEEWRRPPEESSESKRRRHRRRKRTQGGDDGSKGSHRSRERRHRKRSEDRKSIPRDKQSSSHRRISEMDKKHEKTLTVAATLPIQRERKVSFNGYSRLSDFLTMEEFDQGARRLATLDLDENSIRISRKQRKKRTEERRKERPGSAIHTFSSKRSTPRNGHIPPDDDDERPKTARPSRKGKESVPSSSPRAISSSEITPKTRISKEVRRENARRLSMIQVSFSGAFSIYVKGKEQVITGCYVRYVDDTETKLWTELSSADRAGRMSVLTLWKDEQTGKASSFAIQGIHLVPFLSVDDLFELLEKRDLNSGEDRGHDFDIDDYDDGKTPTILRGIKIFKYAQVMKGDDGVSFENKARLMRARDVYARLLQDCSIHKHAHAAIVLAAISSKMNPKKIGEIIKKQHEEILKDGSRRDVLAGCIFSKRHCPYYEEITRLNEDLMASRQEVQIMRDQNATASKSTTIITEELDKLVEAKVDAERASRYYKTKWEEAHGVIIDMSKEAKQMEDDLRMYKDLLVAAESAQKGC